MVHEKYIKRGNKVFGPYLYTNYRENGVTKTRYLGKANKKIKKKLRVNKKFFIILVIFLIIFTFSFIVFFLTEKNVIKIESLKGELASRLLDVFVQIASNHPPEILNVPEELYACEATRFNYTFFVEDDDGVKDLTLNMAPLNPFFVRFITDIHSVPETTILAEAEIYSRILNKQDIMVKRVGGESWAVYSETISADDGELADSVKTNITIIGINNAPEIKNIGVQTVEVWTYGDDNVFDKQVEVEDVEDDRNYGKFDFNLSFLNAEPFFNISEDGVMFLNASENRSLIGVYDLRVCVNDSGLENPHRNIAFCGQDGSSITSCNDFSLVVTDRNRAPNITSYAPENLSLSVNDTDILYFNITAYDPDGNITDTYWYADDVLKEYDNESLFAEFQYAFGCGIAGGHTIKAVVTDGLLNDSVQWDLSVKYMACPSPATPGTTGGTGGGLFCKEEWACEEWGECENLEKAVELGDISKEHEMIIEKRCGLFNYSEEVCGFQIRECFDLKFCGTNFSKPGIISECYYTGEPNCTDGIKNCHNGACEILADCGGSCEPCPTCSDGIQNQNEEKTDCGGICKPCKELPIKPLLFKSVVAYSLIALLIIVLVLVARQVLKYRAFKKTTEKGLKEKIKNAEGFGKQKYLVLFFFLVVVALFFANTYIMSIAEADRVVLDMGEKGVFYSKSLMNIITKNIAKFFMTNIWLSISEGNSYLEIWDYPQTNRYTYPTIFENYGKKYKSEGQYNIYFYANYTDSALSPISDAEGNCDIIFDDGTMNMAYNSTTLLWEYNRSFTYRKNINFDISCTSSYGSPSIPAVISLDNTAPCIFTSLGIDCYGELSQIDCYEDSPCIYNFSAEVADDDFDDVLVLAYQNDFNGFKFDKGLVDFTITTDSDCGVFNVTFLANDDSSSASASKVFNITQVNDAPIFAGLEDKIFNETELFEYIINITDEEDNFPFKVNISFIYCEPAEWSDRVASGDCNLFTEADYILENDGKNWWINISFTPGRNDVGSYTINFTVTDSAELYAPNYYANATTSELVNFTVKVINQAPIFTYICDNERNATENAEFICWINATDTDEVNNITFSSDKNWFLDEEIAGCGIETEYNASINVSFTPTDREVGNWSITISVTDTGEPIKSSLSVIEFFVDNVNDRIVLQDIEDFYGYVGNFYSIELNASDDDFLIPVSNSVVYQENLNFDVRDLNGNIVDWINVREGKTIGNTEIAYLDFSTKPPAPYAGAGAYGINVSVVDASGSIDSKTFTIDISGNNPPVWDNSMNYNLNLIEDNGISLNLSSYVTDADGEEISFSFIKGDIFPSFSLISEELNFTPIDEDVGFHEAEIVATDGKTPSPKNFTFTINNVNDKPFIEIPLQANNVTFIDNYNLVTEEDNDADIFLFVQDDDFLISQKSFYDEKLAINLTIEGNNTILFDFGFDSFILNKAMYIASFVPRKADVGSYNITINVTDKNNASDVFSFNLTIIEINHAPVLMNFTEHHAKINEEFYLDINATDLEDGDDSSGRLSYSCEFLEGSDFILGDENIFNTTSGELKYSFSVAGRYHMNITVRDFYGLNDTRDLWLYVYDVPVISSPAEPCEFNLEENITSGLVFRAGHTAGNNLTYEFYLDDDLKDSLEYYGNYTDLVWEFAPNFTDETYDEAKNLTFLVYPFTFIELNASRKCNVRINHTNAPVLFNGWIGDKSTTYNNRIAIDLTLYFSDIDAEDVHYNQSVDFIVNSSANASSIGYTVSNWTMVLTALVSAPFSETLNIIAYDLDNGGYLTNATSNNFTIEFTTPEITTVPVPTSGGGSEVPISLKILMPGQVSAYEYEKIEISLSLINGGEKSFEELNLESIAFKDGNVAEEIETVLDKNYFKTLRPRQEENLTLTVFFNTNRVGDYEVFVNVTSKIPKYTDWGKIYINLQRINESEVRELILFTEEFVVKNPECIEIKEVIEEAKVYFEKGEIQVAREKTKEALIACEESISQASMPKKRKNFYSISLYLILAILLAFVIGVLYYFIKRRSLMRKQEVES